MTTGDPDQHDGAAARRRPRPGPRTAPAPSPSAQSSSAQSPTKQERALGVETVVVPDRGQWAVDIVVVFADGVVRHRIQTYRSERVAMISAGYIKRGAERDIGGPVHG